MCAHAQGHWDIKATMYAMNALYHTYVLSAGKVIYYTFKMGFRDVEW